MQSPNRFDAQLHLLSCRYVGGVDTNDWWCEIVGRNFFFDPLDYVVAGASVVVSKIVIQADLDHFT